MEKYQLTKHFHFLWPVNVSSLYRNPVCFRLVNIHLILFHVKKFICNMLIIGSINTVKTHGEKKYYNLCLCVAFAAYFSEP